MNLIIRSTKRFLLIVLLTFAWTLQPAHPEQPERVLILGDSIMQAVARSLERQSPGKSGSQPSAGGHIPGITQFIEPYARGIQSVHHSIQRDALGYPGR